MLSEFCKNFGNKDQLIQVITTRVWRDASIVRLLDESDFTGIHVATRNNKQRYIYGFLILLQMMYKCLRNEIVTKTIERESDQTSDVKQIILLFHTTGYIPDFINNYNMTYIHDDYIHMY